MLFLVLVSNCSFAQQLDSLNYQHGYLFWHIYGDNGETLLLLSGGPGNDCKQLHEVASRLSRSYRVLLPEQRGTGRSIPNPFNTATINIDALTEDIERIMDQQSVRKCAIIGHSWGAMLAMNFATKFPDRVKSLILVSPGPHHKWDVNFKIIHENFRARLGRAESHQFDTLLHRVQKGIASSDETVRFRKLFRSAYVYNKAGLDSIYSQIDVEQYPNMQRLILNDLSTNFDLSTSFVDNYTGPLSVICGRQDLMAFNAYELKLLRANLALHWIEEVGHFPMFEQPEHFYSIMREILISTTR